MRVDFLRKCVAVALVGVTAFGPVGMAWGDVYHAKPKLVVIVVIDQLRGDLLLRYRDDFKAARGFNLFMKQGAYFDNCMYDYGNTKTAPGHATIGTGAYTDGHSIGSNEWWDLSRNTDRVVSSVEDERYRLVGTFDDLPTPPAGQPLPTDARIGSSPRNLQATTIGDEVRLATAGESKLFGVSLKDRAAILPSGQSANAAYWIDQATGRFVTSTYYMAQLPAWVTAFNKGPRVHQAVKESGLDDTTQFYNLVGRTPAANAYELDFATELIAQEKLGQGKTTDVLTVSLSANDIVGHQLGPDADTQREMVQELDRDLDKFFTGLDKTVGLENVVIALTADHGIAPIPAQAAALGISAGTLDLEAFDTKMEAALDRKLGLAGDVHALMATEELPYMQLNGPALAKAGVTEAAAEEAFETLAPGIVKSLGAPEMPPNNNATLEGTRKYAESRLPTDAKTVFLRTRLELQSGKLPPTEFGRIVAHSYTDRFGWYVMMVPQAYQMEQLNGIQTTHFSPWSYDRHVPLGFYGAAFVPGEYREQVAPVDIAVTLASLLGVNHPSAAVGRVLLEALQPLR